MLLLLIKLWLRVSQMFDTDEEQITYRALEGISV